MERRGSGFKKIKADYHRAVNFREALEPQFYSDRTNFIVTLFNLNYSVEVGKTGKQENRKTGNQKGAVPQWIQGLPYKQPTLEKSHCCISSMAQKRLLIVAMSCVLQD